MASNKMKVASLVLDPETGRRDLTTYACDLTLDPNTVQDNLVLSDVNKKVTYRSEQQHYPYRPERFDGHPQVLCLEGLTGCHYWEVEWDDASDSKSIYAAVAYKSIERKGHGSDSAFGDNTVSWAFGQWEKDGKPVLSAWHNGKVWDSPFPSGGCSKLAVYLDWPAGRLSFYKVSSDGLIDLYTFSTTFTEPVYPGFWLNKEGNYAYLRSFI